MADDDVEKWLGLDQDAPPMKRQAPVAVQQPRDATPRLRTESNALVLRELEKLNEHAAKIRNWVGWIAIWVVAIPAIGICLWIALKFMVEYDNAQGGF